MNTFLVSLLIFGCQLCFCDAHSYWVEVRAYCPGKCCCGKDARGITKTGRSAYRPGIAVPLPGPVSLGEFITIRGYGRYKADDTGEKMTEEWNQRGTLQVEVRFKTHDEAVKWGVKRKLIFVEHHYAKR